MGADKTATTIEKAFRDARNVLSQAGLPTPELDAALLLEHACGATTLLRMTHPETELTATQARDYANFIGKRLAREPVHRIIGEREFYGLMLELNEATLVPRPDTEILVDVVLPFVHQRILETGVCAILDLGTGTGAIALALLKEALEASATGTDISPKALEMAQNNAARHGLGDRFTAVQSDWFENITESFDLIVSNPPYIATKVIQELDTDVREHDPAIALDGGADGLNSYRLIAAKCSTFMKSDARIAVEIGFDQKNSVSTLFEAAGFMTIASHNDLNGQNRVIFFA